MNIHVHLNLTLHLLGEFLSAIISCHTIPELALSDHLTILPNILAMYSGQQSFGPYKFWTLWTSKKNDQINGF